MINRLHFSPLLLCPGYFYRRFTIFFAQAFQGMDGTITFFLFAAYLELFTKTLAMTWGHF